MNWDTNWKHAELIVANRLPLDERKTFKVRAGLLALLAWVAMWAAFDAALRAL